MIRVNLGGSTSKKPAAAAGKPVTPKASRSGGVSNNMMPAVNLLIIVAAAVVGYFYYSQLAAESADLTNEISQLQQQQSQLDAIIKQNQIHEVRKKALESRIRIIEDLRKNQLSPVVVLDALADAIDRTKFVWLSSLSQNNTTFSMAGTGTSIDALSEFVANLKATGYFRNINLARFTDARGNYTFSMTCEFAPPSYASATEKGAN
jgi:Tfp pilus assembly protein PilN